ncbi:MAG: F0F1 ATP synthase subunit delta [Patescibacteria group bacterium]
MIGKKAKIYARVLLEVLEGQSRKEIRLLSSRFKELLKKRGDLKYLAQILREFKALEEEKKGKLGEVVTANPLSGVVKSQVQKVLEDKGYQMKERVEPSVIGGQAIFLGKEYLIDGTIRGRLQRIAKLLRS